MSKLKFKKLRESVADKLHQRQMALRKKSGLPHPDYYKELSHSYNISDDKERIAKQSEIKKKYKVEEVEQLEEKNVPTNPSLWSKAKSLARSKFDVYPSAYANGWASKWYKSKGGGWKSVNEEKDEKEYDYEGEMVKSDLRSIIANANRLIDMLDDKDNLPEWCQNKITLAEDYVSTVANYMTAEMSESVDRYGSAASETYQQKPNKEEMKKYKKVKENIEEQHREEGRFRPIIPHMVKASHVASPRKKQQKVDEENGQSEKAKIVKNAVKKKKEEQTDKFQSDPVLSTSITKNY